MSIYSALVSQLEADYTKYLIEHIENVKKAWSLMKSNQEVIDYIQDFTKEDNIDGMISQLDRDISEHDNSKFGKDEFNAYRKEFYPVSKEEQDENKKEYDRAWKHHYTHNLHHWDWYYHNNRMDDMPIINVIHMICDWEAMGYKYGNNSKKWYSENKKDIHLGEKQRQFAEGLMDIICK